ASDQRVERVVAELIRYQRGELQGVPRYQVAAGGRYGLHGGTADEDRVVLTLVSPPDDAVTVVGLGRRDALLQLLTEWGKERAPFDRSSHPPQRLRLGEVRYNFTAVGGDWLLGVAHPRGHTVLLARDEEQTLVLVGEGARFEIVLAAAVRDLPQEIDLDRLMRRARGT